jgi:23S rRNA pseudouridine2605 synthase
MLERLQKIISEAGIASRRKAEEMIRQGLVSVNGLTVTELGTKADPERDRIHVAGQGVPRAGPRVTVMLHKPDGCVSTLQDPEGRLTVATLLRRSGLKVRLYPVGRLDYHSTGLLLMTNDGELANYLMSRAAAVPRVYHVKLDSALEDAEIKRLETGIVLDGRKTEPAHIRALRTLSDRKKPWYEVTLVEGRYHQVRRMFERADRQVIKLKRVRLAFLSLERLAPGDWRRLTPLEVKRLKGSHA